MTVDQLPKVAFFPGQGSQYSGMGKSLFENFQDARLVFEECSEALKLNLKRLCFEGSDAELALTENTQPVILTHSIAAFRILKNQFGYEPGWVAGHSLGEYSALVAAEALPLTLAVQWVRARGQAMQKAVPPGEGAMLAVMGMSDTVLEATCKKASEITGKSVSPANFNSDAQTVISGATLAVQAFQTLVKENPEFSRTKMIPLPVSAPFHCALMEPAQAAMKVVFQESGYTPEKLICPIIPNTTAQAHSETGLVLPLLIQQITDSVRWKQTVHTVLELGQTQALEIGPGKVLAGLAKRITHPKLQNSVSVMNISEADSFKEIQS